MKNKIKILIIILAAGTGGYFFVANTVSIYGKVETSVQDPFSNWRPKKEIPGVKFIGNENCLKCHKLNKQLETPMAHALTKNPQGGLIDEFQPKPFKEDKYVYEIKKTKSGLSYSVSDGENTLTFPVLYDFGVGSKGQVYIFNYNDQIYESRVSLYRGPKALDLTVAHSKTVPASLEKAIGRPLSGNDAVSCFGCHSTGAVRNNDLRLEELVEAVSCEACHGPGGNHMQAVIEGDFQNLQIFNPSGLSALEQTQDFCGSCHNGFEQVLKIPKKAHTIRFQPYRLFNSENHMPLGDARLKCTACHDPHDQLIKDPVYYDQKCFSCHVTKPGDKLTETRFVRACSVKTSNCVTCHMPKTYVPEMHFEFTDHWIRIVRPDEDILK